MRKRIAAFALASVMALSLFGCGAKSNSASSAAGVSGDFTGTAKGMGGDVTVTLTLTDSKITGCTLRVPTRPRALVPWLWSSCPARSLRPAASLWTASLVLPSPPMPSRRLQPPL